MAQVIQTQTPQPVSPADQAEVERKVSKAKSLLFLDHPFFGAAVCRRPICYTNSVSTAAMAATGKMYINPAFVLNGTPESGPLTVKHLMFLLPHEAMHYMLSHALRRQHRDPYAWNVAADKVINDMLIDAKVGSFIDGGIRMPGARNYAAEDLYDETDNGGGQGPGGIGNDVGSATDQNGQPLDAATRHSIEARAKIEIVQCAKAAKMAGKLPGSIERMVDEIVHVATPWQDILERYMTSRIKDDMTWRRPNRRFLGSGLYLPGHDTKPQMGAVVIGIDTSGSVGQDELNLYAAHMNRILETCRPEKVVVVYCDSAVAHVDEYGLDDFPVKITPHGGGGTDMTQIFRWVEDNDIEPEVTVILTDGYTPYGDDPGRDVVWAMTSDQEAPYGLTLPVEL